MLKRFGLPLAGALLLCAAPALSATLVPAPVVASDIRLHLDLVGSVGSAASSNNYASPVAIGQDLYVVNQRDAAVTVWRNGIAKPAFAAPPAGVTKLLNIGALNIAGTETTAYVSFTSAYLPPGFAEPPGLPADPAYIDRKNYEVIYAYDRSPDGTLENPKPVTAFATGRNGHRGEGMLVLPDGRLLYARGDALTPSYNGLSAPQDPGSTLSKLLLIDPGSGSVTVAASGVRNVQHLTWTDASRTEIAFADIGWRVAEEINRITLAELTDTTVIENFGWGVAADGKAREGTFYVNDGPESQAVAIDAAPVGEAGFRQPYAQFGRDDRSGYFAVSGPVLSDLSFTQIEMLFGDLASGALFATLRSDLGTGLKTVYEILIEDLDGTAKTLAETLDFTRNDLRFFNFADGSAGLLLEGSAQVFRLTEVTLTPVPLPAGGLLLLSGLGLMALRRRRISARG